MTKDEVQSRLTNVFHEVFDDSSINLHDGLTANDVAGWDSITHVTLIVAVEREFSVRFTTREVHALKNVGELMQLVLTKAK